jgi:hypothetical protein
VSDRPAAGYPSIMTQTSDEGLPIQPEGVPAEEGISGADVADRVDLDPEDQPNRTDPVQGGSPADRDG